MPGKGVSWGVDRDSLDRKGILVSNCTNHTKNSF
jgi:hypothetical protein